MVFMCHNNNNNNNISWKQYIITTVIIIILTTHVTSTQITTINNNNNNNNNITCNDTHVKFCVPSHHFRPCVDVSKYSTHSSECCSCDLNVKEEHCFLNQHTPEAIILYILCMVFAVLLTRLYIATAIREEAEQLEHDRKKIEYQQLYDQFGFEMKVDDFEQNAYDRRDLQFLRLHRILLIGQIIWIANPLATQMTNSNTNTMGKSTNRLTKGVNFFTDTSSYLANCVNITGRNTGREQDYSYIKVQSDFWSVLTISFLITQLVLDMLITCRRVGCKEFGKSSFDDDDDDDDTDEDDGDGNNDNNDKNDNNDNNNDNKAQERTTFNTKCKKCRKGKICNILRRCLRITVLVYLVLFPLCMSMFVQGIACKKDEPDVNAIDGKSNCGINADALAYCIITLILPLIGFTYVYYNINCTKEEKMYDDRFLHDWGYLVIGYKRKMVLWPLVDFLEICFFLLYYYLQLIGQFNVFTRTVFNLITCYGKLFLIETFRPFESTIIYNTARNGSRILVAMFLATIMRIVPQIPDVDEEEINVAILCNDSPRHRISSYLIWFTYGLYGSLIALSFVDYLTRGRVFECFRRKCRKICLGESEVEDDGNDGDVSGFFKLEEDYRIPASQLNILTDTDSDPIYLGAGGFGSVYKATWSQDQGYPVAAKELNATKMKDPNELKDLAAEVSNLVKANHRNVINFYGICEQMDYSRDQDGMRRRFIVMEYAENGSLESFLALASKSYINHIDNSCKTMREKMEHKKLLYPLQAKRIIRWALDIAAGLNYLNSNLKMSHQDVKPHNVLLDRYYTIKICDLGFKQLKRIDDDEEKGNSNHNRRLRYTKSSSGRGNHSSSSKNNSETSIFEERGTAQYKSPEAFETILEEWGEKIDVWAFGVLLKRMVSLRQPFHMSRGADGVSIRDIFKKLPTCELLPFDYFNNDLIYYIHPMLKDLIDLCLSIKPNKRPSFENIVGLLAGMLKEIERGDVGVEKRHHRKNTTDDTNDKIFESINPAFGMSRIGTDRDHLEKGKEKSLRKVKSKPVMNKRLEVKMNRPKSRSDAHRVVHIKNNGNSSTEMRSFQLK